MNSTYLLAFISFAIIIVMAAAGARLNKLKANTFYIAIFAIILGLLIGTIGYLPLSTLPGIYGDWLPVIFYAACMGVSLFVLLRRRESIEKTLDNFGKITEVLLHLRPQIVTQKPQKTQSRDILVDTSVLIDGRIADVVKSGFTPGRLIVPRFVLLELQNIADSDDPLRRAKGRRGLDVLADLKKDLRTNFEVVNQDIPQKEKVDEKLVALGKLRGNEVMTNDYNLNKVAQIDGVKILNINELSQALRPVIIPGEKMELKIIQAGKERHQGVGYLPDGTMIVVEEGDGLVGKMVSVAIKRVLQTAAGKMYFATIEKTKK